MTTLIEVAKLAGVSKSTVSRYFNQGYVSDQARIQIEAAIKATDYSPNRMARSLKAQSSGMVGLVIPRFESPSASLVMAGADDIAYENNQQLLIANTNRDSQRELTAIRTLQQQRVDALITMTHNNEDYLLEAAQTLDIPLLIIGQSYKKLNYISYDDYKAGQILAQKAYNLGHRKISFIGVDPNDLAVGQIRQAGFIDYFEKQGISVQVIRSHFSQSENFALADQLLQAGTETYIACATDQIALAFLSVANDLGFRVPEDLSISGFGGYREGQILAPKLTSVAYPYRQAGKLAMSVILSGLQRHSQTIYQKVLDVELIPGQSLGPI
ncbi:LacI family DNA-binding transcriptional regulator [Aerococcus kribbianus]|uniref:LacI family DNA-binding transcriptional regulator n=1 Tax=Aerococcus kribbianus TaxID=2999064 RepID=A0A9X3FM39_9LACT|nr:MULTISPECIES: LacI family DNA-binding transcriptional regulator [unclassified Aerococcus]MCZ0716890.1 LacI family DNA-binding transcriptional regulator [Aerococcus sp. YH-aer221]MCZ0725178.1 LacI family DNA-binding transcriptional regulator [Aerococcus sp. YH-aer222]